MCVICFFLSRSNLSHGKLEFLRSNITQIKDCPWPLLSRRKTDFQLNSIGIERGEKVRLLLQRFAAEHATNIFFFEITTYLVGKFFCVASFYSTKIARKSFDPQIFFFGRRDFLSSYLPLGGNLHCTVVGLPGGKKAQCRLPFSP